MKNEVASLMKCGQIAWKSKRALLRASIASTSWQRSCRFMFATQTLHLLKSHCIKWILFNWQSRKTPVFLLFLTLLADPNRRPCHTLPHRLLTGSEHRAACGRWSGAMSRKKQRALRRAPRPRWLHITRFRIWRKLIHYRSSSSPPNARIFGHPPARRLYFWLYASLVRVQNGLAIHKPLEHHQLYTQPDNGWLNPITILRI